MKISCIDLSFGENLITGNLFTLRCLLKKEIFIIKIHFVTGLRIFRPENKYCFVVLKQHLSVHNSHHGNESLGSATYQRPVGASQPEADVQQGRSLFTLSPGPGAHLQHHSISS